MNTSAKQKGKRAIYPAYMPSGTNWIGDVPVHWEVRRLKYAASINDEVLPETTDPDYELTYVDIGNVDAAKGIVARETYRFEDAPSRARRIVRDGDTIVSTVRTYLRAIAPIQGADDSLIVSTGFAVVRPRQIDPGYLSYALRSPFFVEKVVSRSTGVSYPAINASEVGDIGIVLPPLPEQHAIAAFLDRETARIDGLIEKKQRQIELLQEKRAALISHAVTKGLDPNANMKPSGIEWLGDVPEHWTVLPIRRVAKMDSGHTPSKTVPEYWTDCDIPWVSLNDTAYLKIHDYIEDTAYHVNALGLANSSAHLLPAPAVVFTRDATIGLCAITKRPMAVSQHIIAWLCGPRITPEYLLRVFYAMTQELERLCMGSTIRTLGMSDVLELVTALPPVAEQQQITDYLDQALPEADSLLGKVEQSIGLLREYRTALISAAVTGKIDVRNLPMETAS